MKDPNMRRDYLLFVSSLVLVHGLDLLIAKVLLAPHLIPPLWPWWFVVPILGVPLVFGFKIRSWQQFVLYAVTTLIVWQVYLYTHNRIYYGVLDHYGPAYPIESFAPMAARRIQESIFAIVPLGVGALLGMIKRRVSTRSYLTSDF
jgi:hypothetical protein